MPRDCDNHAGIERDDRTTDHGTTGPRNLWAEFSSSPDMRPAPIRHTCRPRALCQAEVRPRRLHAPIHQSSPPRVSRHVSPSQVVPWFCPPYLFFASVPIIGVRGSNCFFWNRFFVPSVPCGQWSAFPVSVRSVSRSGCLVVPLFHKSPMNPQKSSLLKATKAKASNTNATGLTQNPHQTSSSRREQAPSKIKGRFRAPAF